MTQWQRLGLMSTLLILTKLSDKVKRLTSDVSCAMSKTVIASSLSATGGPHQCLHGNDRPTNSSRVSAGCAERYLYGGKPLVNPVAERCRPNISISETCEYDWLLGASVIQHRPWYAGETCGSLNTESFMLNERL